MLLFEYRKLIKAGGSLLFSFALILHSLGHLHSLGYSQFVLLLILQS
jgi:hypothetical protein